MIEIKDLLARFRDALLGAEDKKEAVRKIISETIKTEISTEEIEIKNNTIYLKIKPIYKNEIFLRQEEIFSKLKETLGKKAPTGIL
jgi:hypothetical protein